MKMSLSNFSPRTLAQMVAMGLLTPMTQENGRYRWLALRGTSILNLGSDGRWSVVIEAKRGPRTDRHDTITIPVDSEAEAVQIVLWAIG